MKIESVLEKLEYFFQSQDWKGYDPYDGLNSSFLKFLTFKKKWLRIGVIQAMKRLSVNLRPLFGIAKSRNPKAMGLLASAYITLYKQTRDDDYLNKAIEILEWLMQNRAQGYSGSAWGYNFDWQSALFYIPKGVPTVVNTVFISNAFLDAYEVLKKKRYLEIACSTCDFIIKDLNRTYLKDVRSPDPEPHHSRTEKSDTPFCFSYSKSDSTCTHNANLLAVELLTRIHSYTKEKILLDNASMALRFTLPHFNPNGSLYYGIGKKQRYIDSFHTGFILVSLANIAQYSDLDDAHYMRMMMNAYKYYKLTFFEKEGRPHYYHNKIYPIDLHCSAQGIITHLRFKDMDRDALRIARNIADWAIENMWDEKEGYFYFQETRFSINKIPYMRWPNVWMYLALSELTQHISYA